jgi:hypothetical protein
MEMKVDRVKTAEDLVEAHGRDADVRSIEEMMNDALYSHILPKDVVKPLLFRVFDEVSGLFSEHEHNFYDVISAVHPAVSSMKPPFTVDDKNIKDAWKFYPRKHLFENLSSRSTDSKRRKTEHPESFISTGKASVAAKQSDKNKHSGIKKKWIAKKADNLPQASPKETSLTIVENDQDQLQTSNCELYIPFCQFWLNI